MSEPKTEAESGLSEREKKLAALQRAASKHTGIWTEAEKRALAARRSMEEPGARGQALEIAVDNFNGAPETEEEALRWLAAGIAPPAPMCSFLRLGAVPTALKAQIADFVDRSRAGERLSPSAFPTWTGEDLALRVVSFADDKLRRCFDGKPEDSPGPTPDYAHAYRVPTARVAESDDLHTRGGWREHTDGNRISTTRGDKIEVVGGNARLVVLGRDELGFSESGWEGGGGHMSGKTHIRGATSRRQENASGKGEDPLSKISVSWEDRSRGVWTSTESAIKGDGHHVQHGDSEEQGFGHLVWTRTGSETAVDWHAPEDCTFAPEKCQANPKIENRTWATSIETYIGSASRPVPRMESATWADEMRTSSTTERLSTSTRAGTMSSTTRAATLTDETTAERIESTTTASVAMTDLTFVGQHTIETLGSTTDVTIANSVSLTSGLTESRTLGASASLLVGARADLHIGARVSATIGATLDLAIGLKDSRTAGLDVNVSLTSRKDAAAAVDAEVAAVKSFKALLLMIG